MYKTHKNEKERLIGCSLIDKKTRCQQATTPNLRGGRTQRSPIGVGGKGAYVANLNNEPGGCVWLPNSNGGWFKGSVTAK